MMYLKQNISWEPKVGEPDAFGVYEYDAPRIIKGREESEIKDLVGPRGFLRVEVKSIYAQEKVAQYDKLNGQLVTNIEPHIDYSGKAIMYRYFL